MSDEIERLVLSMFREIVEKANTAVKNAEDADDDVSSTMRKAAQSLSKEGERALKKIEPLCKKNRDEYGSNFVDAMKEHEEIGQFRSELEDLLWDFDDYIEVEEFDADKFDEIQKASRRAAPKIVDILKRMKLAAPEPAAVPVDEPKASSGQTSIVVDPSSGTGDDINQIERQLNEMLVMGSQAGPDLGIDGISDSRTNSRQASRPGSELDRNSSHRSTMSSEPLEPPPRPPSIDPWQVDKPSPLNPNVRLEDGTPVERRRPLVAGDSPTLPPVVPLPAIPSDNLGGRSNSTRKGPQRLGSDSFLHQGATVHIDPDSAYWRDRAMNGRLRGDSLSKPGTYEKSRPSYASYSSSELPRYSGQSLDFVSDISRSPTSASPHIGNPPLAIPEGSAVSNYTHTSGHETGIVKFPPRQTSLASNSQLARQPSIDSLNSSIFDIVTDEATSPVASTQRTSSVLSITPGSPYSTGGHLPLYSAPPPGYRSGLHSPVGTINNRSSATLATIHARPHTSGSILRSLPPTPHPREDDPGIIPVDSETSESRQMPPRQSDCSIGPNSSFYQMKGFCKGAEEVIRGELGIKKIKRPVGGFSHTTVAKCTHCLYELDFAAVEQDLNNDSRGNYTSNSIGFRLRVLQKSHLSIRHIEEQLYGCVFCIHDGKTIDESDATVFFNQKQLFSHMARHSRPLPNIPGLTVVEGSEIPEPFRDNFDLHFSGTPVQSVMSGIAPEVSRLPTAIATETRRNAHGIMRSPPDRAAALQFAVGAKIVGIEFPEKYEGRWGVGWHDGVRAAFEAESVHLDAPPKSETRMQGTSSMQAVARWKWSQKGDGNWLKFNQGDVIKNISWTYSDHWCWSGTSGKSWGIFPQSHLEPHSVKIVRPGDEMSVSSAEKKSALGIFSKKRNAEKPEKKKKKEKVTDEQEPGHRRSWSSYT